MRSFIRPLSLPYSTCSFSRRTPPLLRCVHGARLGRSVVCLLQTRGQSNNSRQMIPPQPISAGEFEQLMESVGMHKLASPTKIGVAVSGGPDSMALCLLAQEWARTRQIKMMAFTVDHQLRPESGEEAKQVGTWMHQRGIDHEILTAEWDKPTQVGKIQEAARKYRYSLLYQRCLSQGVNHLMTAHQQEDQIETFILRLIHHSGIEGLAGIQKRHDLILPVLQPAATLLRPLQIIRPLLPITKDRLVATCNYHKQHYVEDPTNTSRKYQRNRIRQELPTIFEQIGREHILQTISRCQELRESMHTLTDKILSDLIVGDDCTFYIIPVDVVQTLSSSIAARVLARIFAHIGGSVEGHRLKRIRDVSDKMIKLSLQLDASPPHVQESFVVAGCLIQLVESPKGRASFLVCKESAKDNKRTEIQVGNTVFWEDRLAISVFQNAESEAGQGAETLYIRRYKSTDKATNSSVSWLLRGVPTRARMALPVIEDSAGRVVALPSFKACLRHDLSVHAQPVCPLLPRQQ